MSRSLPPPRIPGLTYVQDLGHGGFADVFLYEQAMPARMVAIKVIKDGGHGVAGRFAAEANAMAQLEHPHIVPVYSTGTTSDGRPFLAMQYYPQASLSERAKRERFSVAETLRIGIQLASAVETAHRAGLLHRDIKPANVLTSQYGRPGLTDFGIAGQAQDADDDDMGVSVPWSPPETLYATAPASARSDVYSLAATLWHLLAGRSPFEVPGGDNTHFGLMQRVRDHPVPALTRADVPASLEGLLGSALAKDPAHRPASALVLAQSLQLVEQELRLPRTEIVLAASPVGRDARRREDDATRVKAPQRLAEAQVPQLLQGPPPPAHERHSVAAPATGTESETQRARQPWLLFLVPAVIVAGIAVALISAPRPVQPSASPSASETAPPPDLGPLVPPGPVTITAHRNGDKVTFTWKYSAYVESDTYRWRGLDGEVKVVRDARLVVRSKKRACLQVQVLRFDGSNADPTWSERSCA